MLQTNSRWIAGIRYARLWMAVSISSMLRRVWKDMRILSIRADGWSDYGLVVDGDDGVVEAVATQALWDSMPDGTGGVLVAAEGEDGLVHMGGVKDAEIHQEVEVLDGQSGDGAEQAGFELGDDVGKGSHGSRSGYMNAGMRVANLTSFS